jgi:hypothetical protein
MARKSMMGEAADAVKTVAGTALGAAAAAATNVVTSVADAIAKGGAKLEKAEPSLKKSAARAVSKPIKPKRKSAPAGKRKAVVKKPSAKAKAAAKKKHG